MVILNDTMVTLNEVYRAIKWLSKMQMNPRPLLQVETLSGQLQCSTERIMPFLQELKEMRLIKFEDLHAHSIKLTLLGNAVERNQP